MLMENFLWSKEYWSVVEFGIQEPPAGTGFDRSLESKIGS